MSAGARSRALVGWGAVVCAGIALLTLRGAPAGAQAYDLSEQDLAMGGTLYAQNCAQCHGGDAQGGVLIPGTDVVGPPLVGTAAVGVAYVDLVIRTGRMPPAGDPFDNRARDVVLDDAERQAVVGFMQAEFGLEGDLPNLNGGDAGRGQQVYATNCAQCHGSTGAGGVAGAGAFTPQVHDADPITIAEAIRVGPFEMPAFGPGQINDEELGDIAAFLQVVDSEEGTVLGLVELNPVFASGFVAVLALVLIVSLFWIAGRPTLFADTEIPLDAQVPKDGAEDQA